MIGGLAALGYFIISLLLVTYLQFSVAGAGFVAYLMMIPVAYFGHKKHTFQSNDLHRSEFPRFFFSAVIGIILSSLIPWLFTSIMYLNPVVGFSVACISVPLINFVLLKKYVFVYLDGSNNNG